MSLLLRNTIKSNYTLQSFNPRHSLPSFLRQSSKHFSTETEQPSPSQQPPQENNPSTDPFGYSSTGLTYAKYSGLNRHTFKTDIIHFFEGCNLTSHDVRFTYRPNFEPSASLIQFPSQRAFENALKVHTKKGRLGRLDKVDRREWDAVEPSDGKTILLQGIPQNAALNDVERFLSGCEFVPSSIRFFVKSLQEFRDPIRMATIRFFTRTEAMNASIKKNGGFCLNNKISVRVLQ